MSELLRIVTPEQLAEGYVTRRSREFVPETDPLPPSGVCIYDHYNYKVVGYLPDGNYVVKEPG